MAQRKLKKVKVHRAYKNFISISMILVGLAIIALTVLNISGFGNVSILALKDKISSLSNKVANGKDYNYDSLNEDELSELNVEILTFSSNFNSTENNEMIYFRSGSLGDWDAKNDMFTKPKLYSTKNDISPLVLYANKALNNSQNYKIDITLNSYLDTKLALDYTSFAKEAKNDCYFSATTKKETSYSMDFAPTYDYTLAKQVSYSNSEYQTIEENYRKHVYDNYLTVSSSLKPRLENFLRNNNLSKDSPTIIDDVSNFLKNNYTYNLNVPSSNGEDNVIFFLETSKIGICNNFAAASVMLYRTLGIPARFVNGFMAKSLGNNTPQQIHYQSAHAWSEVYIDGSGWFRVDTTSNRLDIDYPYNYSENQPQDVPSDIGGGGENKNVLPTISFTASYYRYYDGLPHSPSDDADEIVKISNLPEGYTYTTNFSREVTNLVDAGSYSFLVEIKIFDPSGENVTSKLVSGAQDGSIIQGPYTYNILRRPIMIKSSSKEYNLPNSGFVFNDTILDLEISLNTNVANSQILSRMTDEEKEIGIASKDSYSTSFTHYYFTQVGEYTNSFTLDYIIDQSTRESSLRNYEVYPVFGVINVV